MDGRLLDTNIVSYSFNQHTLYSLYLPLIEKRTLLVSFMTIGEILEGAKRANWGVVRLAKMDVLLKDLIVIDSNRKICEIWAEIRHLRRKQPIEAADAWIAATAIACGVPLVTHNAKDFTGIPQLQIVTA